MHGLRGEWPHQTTWTPPGGRAGLCWRPVAVSSGPGLTAVPHVRSCTATLAGHRQCGLCARTRGARAGAQHMALEAPPPAPQERVPRSRLHLRQRGPPGLGSCRPAPSSLRVWGETRRLTGVRSLAWGSAACSCWLCSRLCMAVWGRRVTPVPGLQPSASPAGPGVWALWPPKAQHSPPSAHARPHCIFTVPLRCGWGARTPGFLMKLRESLGGIRWLPTPESLQRTGQGRLARAAGPSEAPARAGLGGSIRVAAQAAGGWGPGAHSPPRRPCCRC